MTCFNKKKRVYKRYLWIFKVRTIYQPLYNPRTPSFVIVFLAQSIVPLYNTVPLGPGTGMV